MDAYLGLALECIVDGVDETRVLVCFDEEGVRYEYRGPTNPQSTTTIYGRWTGPSAFCDDVPVKVNGRYGKQTSALDSFSMLYTILTYQYGYHNININQRYVERISAALKRGVITAFRDNDEFLAATKIIQSFEKTGHVFNVISPEAKFSYAAGVGAIPKTSQWIDHDANQSYPLFVLTDEEKSQIGKAFEGNYRHIRSVQDVIDAMEMAGLSHHYAVVWMKQKYFQAQQMEYAKDYLVEQMKGIVRDPLLLPSWDRSKKSSVMLENASSIQAIAHNITASIIESLL